MEKIKGKLLKLLYWLPSLAKFIPPVLMTVGLTCLVIGAFLFGIKLGFISLGIVLIILSILLAP